MEYLADELTEDEYRILMAIPFNEVVLTAEVARVAGIANMSKVRRILYKLEEYREVCRVKKTNPISWKRTPDNT